MQDVMTQLKAVFLDLAPVIFAILEPLKWLAEKLRENPRAAKALGYALMTFLGYKMFAGPIKGIGGLVKGLVGAKKATEGMGGALKGGVGGLESMKFLLYIAAFTGLLLAIGSIMDPGQGGGADALIGIALGIGLLLGSLLLFSSFLQNPALLVAFKALTVGLFLMSLGFAAIAAAIALLPEGVLNKLFGVEEPPQMPEMEGDFDVASLTQLEALNWDNISEGLESLVDPMNNLADASQKLNTKGLEALADLPRSMQLLDGEKTNQMIAILQAGAELNQPAPDTLLSTLNELIAAVTDSGAGIQGAIAGQKDKKLPELVVRTDNRAFSDFIKDTVWEEMTG